MAPLKGIRVLDATRLLPGGFCSMLLSEMGAEVIKVEQPGLGDYMRLTPPLKDVSMVHAMVNRNKRSIGLNLKKAEGRKVMEALIRRSDIFLEGFRPGAMERLGFSFQSARRINSRIVYCSISAFGRRSRLSSVPSHDLSLQALAGTLGSTRKPLVPFVQYADLTAGLYAALGILATLQRRPRTATLVDVPIVQSLMSLLILPASAYFTTGKRNRPGGHLVLGSESFYNLYRTSDGRYMAVAAIEQQFWSNLLRELGLSSMDARRHGTKEEREAVTLEFERVFATRTRDEWTKLLMESDTCTTPVLDIEEALDSEWSDVAGRGNERHLKLPVTFEPSGLSRSSSAPSLGQHSREILEELGFSEARIGRLEKDGVVST